MGANVNIVAADRKYNSAALEKSKVVSTQGGKVATVVCYNKSGADFWLLIFDAASLPADAQPADFAPLLVPNGATGSYDIPAALPFGLGLVVCASSSDVTKTLIGSNGAWFTVGYSEK